MTDHQATVDKWLEKMEKKFHLWSFASNMRPLERRSDLYDTNGDLARDLASFSVVQIFIWSTKRLSRLPIMIKFLKVPSFLLKKCAEDGPSNYCSSPRLTEARYRSGIQPIPWLHKLESQQRRCFNCEIFAAWQLARMYLPSWRISVVCTHRKASSSSFQHWVSPGPQLWPKGVIDPCSQRASLDEVKSIQEERHKRRLSTWYAEEKGNIKLVWSKWSQWLFKVTWTYVQFRFQELRTIRVSYTVAMSPEVQAPKKNELWRRNTCKTEKDTWHKIKCDWGDKNNQKISLRTVWSWSRKRAKRTHEWRCSILQKVKPCMRPYWKGMSCIIYSLVGTLPNIAHSVQTLSKFVERPKETHCVCVQRVLKYTLSNKHLGLGHGGPV